MAWWVNTKVFLHGIVRGVGMQAGRSSICENMNEISASTSVNNNH